MFVRAWTVTCVTSILLPSLSCLVLSVVLGRCTPEQKEIYYLCAPNRDLAEASPYYEAFRASGREVGGKWGVGRCRRLSTMYLASV